MPGLFQSVRRFWRDETGATAIEYALLAALVGVVLITSLSMLSSSLWNVYVLGIGNKLDEAAAN